MYTIYIISPYIYVEYILCSLNFMFRMFKDFMVYFIYFSWKNGLNHSGYSTWDNHLSSSWSSSGNRRDSDCLLTKSTLRQAFISVWRDVTTSIGLPICWVFGNVWKWHNDTKHNLWWNFTEILDVSVPVRSNSWKLKNKIRRTQHGAQLLREGTGLVFFGVLKV